MVKNMRLSMKMEYLGNCKTVIDFYSAVFKGIEIDYKTYKEMPLSSVLGINGEALEMVWEGKIQISIGNTILDLRVADSVLVAMKNNIGLDKPLYNPVVYIYHNDEDYVHNVLKNLYGDKHNDVFNEKNADSYGICWRYAKNDKCAICYCLTFDGFCKEVIDFYENAFDVKVKNVVKYGETSNLLDKISLEGKEMIYSAIFCINREDKEYIIMLRDSLEAAVSGINSYDKNALLFYQGKYNPLFEIRDTNEARLFEIFDKIKEGCKLNRVLSYNEQGILYGSLIDKYGICWSFYSTDD